MTEKEIIEKLGSMRVDTGERLPLQYIFCLVPNNDYDPENFSQEIEDSEEPTSFSDHFWGRKTNSEKWLKNHTKKCSTKVVPTHLLPCINRSDGTRDYNHKPVLDAIAEIKEEYGEIIDLT